MLRLFTRFPARILASRALAVVTTSTSTGLHDSPNHNVILEKKLLCPDIMEFVVKSPGIAKHCAAGHFVVVLSSETAERIPLTIADYDAQAETITMVIQDVGASSHKICALEEGDKFNAILGPLGKPTEVENYGNVVVIGGGVGVAPVQPIAKSLKAAGNKVTSIIGARNKDMLFWEDRMAASSDELIACTDDGSYGVSGFVTAPLKELLAKGEKPDHIWAVGPVGMMAGIADVTREAGIPTTVSLNSLMVDGTGMCGGCRVEVGGETMFTCVDGPEFDAHKVNFPEMVARQKQYVPQEETARVAPDSGPTFVDPKCKVDYGDLNYDRIAMPEQPANERIHNFDEVALGYSPEQAMAEAARCLQCDSPLCETCCPVGIEIPECLDLVASGDFLGAYKKFTEKNVLPAVCGRVCPQENQCEKVCDYRRMTWRGQPVAVGRIERFVADWAREHNVHQDLKPPTEKREGKIAVVGSGPSGITVAGDLIQKGYDVTVFEALHKLGGVLAYGIPEFRLPKSIVDHEIDVLQQQGVKFLTNTPVGPCGTVQELMAEEKFDAVFLGLGAGLPYFLEIPGENLNGVYSANEYLTRINLMKAYKFPEYDTPVLPGQRVAVVGGGNVAMDSARSARRMGAEVFLVYRRSEAELPARAEEIHHAFEEGIQMMALTNPLEVLGDEHGWVRALRCEKMRLGDPDESGRRRPIPIEGSEHELPVDQVVVAIGNGANPMLTNTFPELGVDKWGLIKADKDGRTTVPGVFAGGDIVTGAATVIAAMGAGRKSATAIIDYLEGTTEWPSL